MHLLSVSVGGWGIVLMIMIGMGMIILMINLWLLSLLGRIQKMPRSHAKGSWWLININLLEPIISTTWMVGIVLGKDYDVYRSFWAIANTFWQWKFLWGMPSQDTLETLIQCLTLYWPMLVCLIVIPIIGLVNSDSITRQTARLSLKYGFLRLYGVYIALIVAQESQYFPILIGSFGLSIYTYRKMYRHAKTILQHPSQAVTIHNQQLAIGSANPETSQISTIM